MSTSLPPAFSLGPVSTLQEMLRTIAFVNRSLPFLRPTGRFDEETLEAVMMFQKINGLRKAGVSLEPAKVSCGVLIQDTCGGGRCDSLQNFSQCTEHILERTE